MGAVIRHYVAVKDGVVVGSRSTVKRYLWAVLHEGAEGWFATFHTQFEGAEFAVAAMLTSAPRKEVVSVVETRERLTVGTPAPAWIVSLPVDLAAARRGWAVH